MGIFDGSTSASGNSSSAESSSWSHGEGFSDSWSRTYGTEASIRSAMEADRANALQEYWMNKEMAFNAAEAQKQRDFNELMGNTLYTRSVKNMMEAGINPILSAQSGLSGANVNSGATASISAPSAFMGQTFADQASASHSQWVSDSGSESHSSGSGWSNSESGLATALQNMGEFIGSGLSALSSAKLFDINIGNDSKNGNLGTKVANSIANYIKDNSWWDSSKGRQLTEKERKEEGFWEGLNRAVLNKANANMGISGK